MSDDNMLALPVCALCGGVAARCPCPSVDLGIMPDGPYKGYALRVCSPTTPVDVFCDGSGTTGDKPCGAGIVFERDGFVLFESAVSLGLGTNNVAEVGAIGIALALLQEAYSKQVLARIHTDSQWALDASAPDCTWKLQDGPAQRFALRVRQLRAEMPRVTFHKVKGHSGVPGNERADELANIARLRPISMARQGQ
jgi:ribonuclease HI